MPAWPAAPTSIDQQLRAELIGSMSDMVFTARGILEQFRETVWFPLVLGMKHVIKEMEPLVTILAKDGQIARLRNNEPPI